MARARVQERNTTESTEYTEIRRAVSLCVSVLSVL
jgi:hypothetical protein